MIITALWQLLLLIGIFYFMALITDKHFLPVLDQLQVRWNLSEDVAGATLMAAGSSAPELFISLLALGKSVEMGDFSAGTIVGSAAFNALVIIGCAAWITQTRLWWWPLWRDFGIYVVALSSLYFISQDGIITWQEGAALSILYLCYVALLLGGPKNKLSASASNPAAAPANIPIEAATNMLATPVAAANTAPWGRFIYPMPIHHIFSQMLQLLLPKQAAATHWWLLAFIVSIGFIGSLSWLLVEVGVSLAETLHIPRALIALLIVAVGTSVPDWLASIAAAKRGHADMAVSNASGSNIFNILIGLGLVWMCMSLYYGHSLSLPIEALSTSILWLLGIQLGLLMLLTIKRYRLDKIASVLLLGGYLGYLAWNILTLGNALSL